MTDATQLATIFHTGTILFETIKEHSYIIVIGVEYEHGT